MNAVVDDLIRKNDDGDDFSLIIYPPSVTNSL